MIADKLEAEEVGEAFQHAAIKAGFENYSFGKKDGSAYIQVLEEPDKRTTIHYEEDEELVFSNTDPVFDPFYRNLRHELKELI